MMGLHGKHTARTVKDQLQSPLPTSSTPTEQVRPQKAPSENDTFLLHGPSRHVLSMPFLADSRALITCFAVLAITSYEFVYLSLLGHRLNEQEVYL